MNPARLYQAARMRHSYQIHGTVLGTKIILTGTNRNTLNDLTLFRKYQLISFYHLADV